MARLASEAKGGFYATPESEMRLVLNRLRFAPGESESKLVNLLDPCAGYGVALNMLQDHLKHQGAEPVSYAVELELNRSKEAAAVLDNVIQGGYETFRSESKYAALWLNPPYDDGFDERVEAQFLRHLTGRAHLTLQRNGLLMFCVPQYILKDSAGRLIAGRFHDVKVYRFTYENYDTFKQVVVFGYYGKAKDEERKETLKYLKQVGESGPEVLPALDADDSVVFDVGSSETIDLFRGGANRAEEVAKDLLESILYDEVAKKVGEDVTRKNATMKRPVLPLKPSHYGIAIAAGAVGGNMGTHILSGVTKQIIEVKPIRDEEGRQTGEQINKFHRSIVRCFSPEHGVVDIQA